jgi:hypothetical protein
MVLANRVNIFEDFNPSILGLYLYNFLFL